MQFRLIWSFTVVLFLYCTQLPAASVLNFPRLSYEDGTLTGFAIVNPNDSNAVVTLTAYDSEGRIIEASGFNNPREVTVPAGSQFADTSLTIFSSRLQDGDTVAWLQATSETDGLTGFFLFLNIPSISFFDGADLPPLAEEIVFNEVRTTGGFSTEINLINPGDQRANVQLQLIGQGGSDAQNISIAAKGVFRLDVAEFFGLGPAGAGGGLETRVLLAAADREIGGFEFIRGEGDLLGLNARPRSEQLNTLFFPQLAVLDPFETQLVLANYGNEQAIVTITAFRPDGMPYGTEDLQNNPAVLPLAAGAVARLDVEELFGFSGPRTLEGWLKAESTSAVVNGSLSYAIPALGSRAAVSAVGEADTELVFSHIATTQGFFTGVAVLNGSSLVANVRIVALRPDGALFGIFSTTLLPGQRMSRLLSDLIPEAAGQAGGLIWVSSDVPVYAISLFGSGTVLANIPPQAVPPTFEPDRGEAKLSVQPGLAIVASGDSQTFQASGVAGNPVWSVNGVAGGNAAVGTITGQGFYRAPAQTPMLLPVSVSAAIGRQVAGASVDVISPEVLYGNLGLVQSVAYLSGQQRLFSAELLVAGPTVASLGAQGALSDSGIFDVTGGDRTQAAGFPGEDIPKMIPYQAANGREYLLLAARTSGRILRLDPDSGESVGVESGLESPNAMVLDPATGNLLVAEANRISVVAAGRLGQGPTAAAARSYPRPAGLAEGITPRGIAVDACTGNIYFSDASTASIRVINPATGEVATVVEGIEAGQLLSLYREGVPCPSSFRLLAVEPDIGRISLVNPADGSITVMLTGTDFRDVILLPPGNPLTGTTSVVASSIVGDEGRLLQVDLPGLYSPGPTLNPPVLPPCLLVSLRDPVLEAAVREALGLAPGAPIPCDQAETLTALDITGGQSSPAKIQGPAPTGESSAVVTSLAGLDAFFNLEVLRANRNAITDLTPLGGLTKLHTLELGSNDLDGNLDPLTGLTALRQLDLSENSTISDLSSLAGLPALQLLDLESCSIESISALVDNSALGSGDRVLLAGNPLGESACEDIQTLRDRGAGVNAAGTLCQPDISPGEVGPVHVYQFLGSFVDSLGGPDLQPAGGAVGDDEYFFGTGEGLMLRGGGFDPESYSIELRFQLDDVSGAGKILDFMDLGDDSGLYVSEGRAEFRPVASNSDMAFPPGEPIHLVLTRGETCNLFNVCSQQVSVYVDGDLQLSFEDPEGRTIPSGADRALNFFLDDMATTGTEASAGQVDEIRIYNGVLPASVVREIAGGGCGPVEILFGRCEP